MSEVGPLVQSQPGLLSEGRALRSLGSLDTLRTLNARLALHLRHYLDDHGLYQSLDVTSGDRRAHGSLSAFDALRSLGALRTLDALRALRALGATSRYEQGPKGHKG